MSEPSLPVTQATEILSRLRRRSDRRGRLWNAHVAGFIAVNGFLAFLDLVTGGGLWFPYVTGAMAIPFVAHAVSRHRRDRFQRRLEHELERQPDLPDRMFRPFRKLHRSATHFMMGVASGAAVSGYLFLINVMTGGSFWSIIPAASIALPVVFHGLLARSRQATFRAQLQAGGDQLEEGTGRIARRIERQRRRRERRKLETLIDSSAPANGSGAAPVPRSAADRGEPHEHELIAEARRLEEEIVGRGGSQSVPVELAGSVHDLVGEIVRMGELSGEFERALTRFSPDELQRDKKTLEKRLADPASQTLHGQYQETLDQIERQLRALGELEDRSELLELRIRAGINSLRQINVDLVRVQGDATLGSINRLVNERTEELSTYLVDLHDSYRELSQEMTGSS